MRPSFTDTFQNEGGQHVDDSGHEKSTAMVKSATNVTRKSGGRVLHKHHAGSVHAEQRTQGRRANPASIGGMWCAFICVTLGACINADPLDDVALTVSDASETSETAALMSCIQDVVATDAQFATRPGFNSNYTSLTNYRIQGRTNAPIIVFIHGGGWVEGDKDEILNTPIVEAFLSDGAAVVAANYRPVLPGNGVLYDEQADDVAAAIAWAHGQAETFGGDRNRILLMGFSSGAHLVSLVATDPRYLGKYDLTVNHLSGVVALDVPAYDIPYAISSAQSLGWPSGKSSLEAVFTTNVAIQRDASPMHHLQDVPTRPRFLVVSAQYQSTPTGLKSTNFTQAMSARFVEALITSGTGAVHVHFPVSHSTLVNELGNDISLTSTVWNFWDDVDLTRGWGSYVDAYPDLSVAYVVMERGGLTTVAQFNEYKATYGVGINEKWWVDVWNRLHPEKFIADIAQLSRTEWGQLHFEASGEMEGRLIDSDLRLDAVAKPDFTKYVEQNRDLTLAFSDLSVMGRYSDWMAANGSYKRTFGVGLDERTYLNLWNGFGGKQITDIGQLSKAEWGMIHYHGWGRVERRVLPTTFVAPPSIRGWSSYVGGHRDLFLAYDAMKRDGLTTPSQMNEYLAAYGIGLNERLVVDQWNTLHPLLPVTDVGQLTRAEWGELHHTIWGAATHVQIPHLRLQVCPG